jgi:DNA-binding response OmpR family regulator
MERSILILLAEDEALIALTLQDALEEAGFGVYYVSVGSDAIKALDEKNSEISGVITDIRLEGPVDGWAIGRHARQLTPHIAVVYMSGDSAQDHTVQGVPDSIMLQKPFAAAQVVTAISTLLNAMPPQAA